MKLCRPLLLAAALLAPLAVRAAEAPDAEFTRVAALVQAKRTDEAVREIDVLIRRYPNDARLPKIRAQLGSAASVATAPAAPAMPAEDRFEINTVRKLMEKAQATTEADSRRLLLEQVLERTERLVRKYPKDISTWTMRAMAAIVLDRPTEGRPAAQTLKSLGALESDDTALGELMAELNIKGWLKDEAQLTDEASVRIRKWAGTWTRPEKSLGNLGWVPEYTLSIDASLAPAVSISFEKNAPFRHAAAYPYSTGGTFKLPGMNIGRTVADEGYIMQSYHVANRLKNIRFVASESVLVISYHAEGTSSNHGDVSTVSEDKTLCFFYDPNIREALIELYNSEWQLPPDELRRVVAARLHNPDSIVLLRK